MIEFIKNMFLRDCSINSFNEKNGSGGGSCYWTYNEAVIEAERLMQHNYTVEITRKSAGDRVVWRNGDICDDPSTRGFSIAIGGKGTAIGGENGETK